MRPWPPVNESPDPRRRYWIRAILVAGVVLAATGLLAVLKARPLRSELDGAASGSAGSRGQGTPALSRAALRVRIVDARGRPVPSAAVFLLAASNDAPADASWSPDSGTLTLTVPPGGAAAPRALRVTARGYRTQEIAGIVAHRTVVLERGLQMRILLRGVPRDQAPGKETPQDGIPDHIRILLRVRPAGADPDTAGASEVIGLMDNLGKPGSGPRDIPRGGFGYPVSLTQAHAGVLVPEPGIYHVHWGLIDTQADTWFSLGARCGRRIDVRDIAQVQTFAFAMTPADLRETLAGLARGVEHVGR